MSERWLMSSGNVFTVPTDSDVPMFRPVLEPTGEALRYDDAGFVRVAEQLGTEWRWNIRARRVEYRLAGSASPLWQAATDLDFAAYRLEAARLFVTATSRGDRPWKPAQTDWDMMLHGHCRSRQVDPFADWLNSLPDWDGQDRAETLMIRLFQLDDTPLHRWVSRYPLLAAVQRTITPGAQIREHPVLFGPQNIGKSAIFRLLLPSRGRGDWHGDALDLDGNNTEKAESMAGRVIVEVPEMAGYRKADIERLKAFLSRTDDGQVRMKYARTPVSTPRRCAIVMTGNPELAKLPNDPSGNTRFVAVSCNPPDGPIEPVVDAERHQLWAETVHKHLDGTWPTAGLPRDLTVIQGDANEDFRDVDETFETLIMGLHSAEPLTLNEIALGIDVDPIHNGRRLQTALRQCGWVYDPKRIIRNGKQVRLWHPPALQVEFDDAAIRMIPNDELDEHTVLDEGDDWYPPNELDF